jgi:hypothetical protein
MKSGQVAHSLTPGQGNVVDVVTKHIELLLRKTRSKTWKGNVSFDDYGNVIPVKIMLKSQVKTEVKT